MTHYIVEDMFVTLGVARHEIPRQNGPHLRGLTYLEQLQCLLLTNYLLMSLIILLTETSKGRRHFLFLFITSLPRWNEVVRFQEGGSFDIGCPNIQPIFIHHDLLADDLLSIILHKTKTLMVSYFDLFQSLPLIRCSLLPFGLFSWQDCGQSWMLLLMLLCSFCNCQI